MSETFSILFRGDILPGHTLPDVKARMAQLFKLDDAKLAMVFSGKPVALKKDCDAAMVEKLRAVLSKAGAEVEVRSNNPPSKKAPPEPATAPSAPSNSATPSNLPASSAQATSGELQVAPIGPVMSEAERAAQRPRPVKVDVSHISMEKKASVFMAADELPVSAQRPEINAPSFDLFEAGVELLKPDERTPYEELQLDLSAYEVAELGADLQREEDKVPLPIMEIEELNVDLAPVGADVGEIKKPAPPPPPKTDHLSLA